VVLSFSVEVLIGVIDACGVGEEDIKEEVIDQPEYGNGAGAACAGVVPSTGDSDCEAAEPEERYLLVWSRVVGSAEGGMKRRVSKLVADTTLCFLATGISNPLSSKSNALAGFRSA
jgi:hypothetical protein